MNSGECLQDNLTKKVYTEPHFPSISQANINCQIVNKDQQDSTYFESKVHWSYGQADPTDCPYIEPLLVVTTLEDTNGKILTSNYILLFNELEPDDHGSELDLVDTRIASFCEHFQSFDTPYSWQPTALTPTSQSDLDFAFPGDEQTGKWF